MSEYFSRSYMTDRDGSSSQNCRTLVRQNTLTRALGLFCAPFLRYISGEEVVVVVDDVVLLHEFGDNLGAADEEDVAPVSRCFNCRGLSFDAAAAAAQPQEQQGVTSDCDVTFFSPASLHSDDRPILSHFHRLFRSEQ